MGLMQLMPVTWRLYRDRLRLGRDPYNPHDNILAGAAYLHDLIQRLGLLDGLAAYFAGPKTVTDSHNDNTLPYPATLRYVHAVLGIIAAETDRTTARATTGRDPSSSLFAIKRRSVGHNSDIQKGSSSALFAITRAHVHDKAVDDESSGPVQ